MSRSSARWGQPAQERGAALGRLRTVTGGTARVVALVLLLVLVTPWTAGAVPHESESWVRVRTRHFELIGEVPVSHLSRIGVRLERFRAILHHGRTDTAAAETTRSYVIHTVGTSTRIDDLPGPGLVAGGSAHWDIYRIDGQTIVDPSFVPSSRESFATSVGVRFRVAPGSATRNL